MFTRDVECPKCGAKVGYPCRTSGGYRAGVHIARWNAIGRKSVLDLSAEEALADYHNGIAWDLKLRGGALESISDRLMCS